MNKVQMINLQIEAKYTEEEVTEYIGKKKTRYSTIVQKKSGKSTKEEMEEGKRGKAIGQHSLRGRMD